MCPPKDRQTFVVSLILSRPCGIKLANLLYQTRPLDLKQVWLTKGAVMKHRILLGAGALIAVVAICQLARAQNAENTKRFDAQESAFLRQAAQEDVFEQRFGQYAAEHAATEEVKQLGKQMATDHQADLKVIAQLAQDHGLDLQGHDNDITPEQKTIYDRITSKAGKDFDKEYTKLMVAEHSRVVALYSRERDHATDVAVREYAGKQVDGLKHHLDMSKDAQKVAWGT
jgi:putative membrane protein